jgi:hypothetical protein
MHRIRVSLGPYGYWLKSRDEDDPETVPASGLIPDNVCRSASLALLISTSAAGAWLASALPAPEPRQHASEPT